MAHYSAPHGKHTASEWRILMLWTMMGLLENILFGVRLWGSWSEWRTWSWFGSSLENEAGKLACQLGHPPFDKKYFIQSSKQLHSIQKEVKAQMKLDATDLRYLSTEEFRVLTAVSLNLFCSVTGTYTND
jgi:hypothetical protein